MLARINLGHEPEVLQEVFRADTMQTPVDEHILSARFRHTTGHISVIVAYSPTECADRQTKEEFYTRLERVRSCGKRFESGPW